MVNHPSANPLHLKSRSGKSLVLKALVAHDNAQWDEACQNNGKIQHLVGVDEVGRGSCIGPVTAAAVLFEPDIIDAYPEVLAPLNDSKTLTAKQRETLHHHLTQYHAYAIGEASQEEVETLNVHQASLLAAYRAVVGLLQKQQLISQGDSPIPESVFVLLDGRATLPQWPKTQQKAIIKGDGQSFSIAAASIIAKHHRDTYVQTLAKDYPQYGWDKNMGYATAQHQAAIRQYGITPHHRRTYRLSGNISANRSGISTNNDSAKKKLAKNIS